MRPTAPFRLYRILTTLALPFIARSVVNKLRKAGVPVNRAHERLGHATKPKRLGPLIWFHAASVGEAKSVLPLMARLSDIQPELQLLLTSGTATSAQAVAQHLPLRTVHQFAPLDGTGPLRRFLDHWRPDLCVLVESELWPGLLDICARRDIPVALINARLSDQSVQGWLHFPATAQYVFRGIRFAHCQDRRSRDHLRAMGLSFAQQGQNLKAMIPPVTLPPNALDTVRSNLANRPVWVAASTHAGEEEGVLAAHQDLLRDHPNLCLILAPRHPERANEVLDLIHAVSLTVAQRSTGGTLSERPQVYLADTIGEMDLWYALCPIAFLGGSWTDAGGHSPFEPAVAHTAILHGQKYTNFAESYAAFLMKDASIEVPNSTALSQSVAMLLTHPSRAAQLAANARPLAHSSGAALNDIAGQFLALAKITTPLPHG